MSLILQKFTYIWRLRDEGLYGCWFVSLFRGEYLQKFPILTKCRWWTKTNYQTKFRWNSFHRSQKMWKLTNFKKELNTMTNYEIFLLSVKSHCLLREMPRKCEEFIITNHTSLCVHHIWRSTRARIITFYVRDFHLTANRCTSAMKFEAIYNLAWESLRALYNGAEKEKRILRENRVPLFLRYWQRVSCITAKKEVIEIFLPKTMH